MAKIIEKIVQSKYPPKDTNVLWDDGENLKISRNGSFENVVSTVENNKTNLAVEVTVDNTTGNPSADATIENGTIKLAFSGLKGETGPQGEQGEQGAVGELEVVNNLIDGGETAALSAEQGKMLDTKITELSEKVGDRDPNGGMGYVILRKNKTFAEQVTKESTIYEIRYDFDLKGEEFTMCKKCILYFNGGSLSNGTILGDGTSIKASNYEIFKHGNSSFRGYKIENRYEYVHHKSNAITIGGTWTNKFVSPYWVGLLESSSCHSLQINNYIKLHDIGECVVFPYGRKYIIYDTIRADGYNINFNASIFTLPDDYSNIEDASLPLPYGAEGVSMQHPGYCLWYGGENITIEGLTIDENKDSRNEDAAGLGIQFAVNIINTSHNVTTKDCRFINLVDCGHQIGADPYDLSFENCEWSNVGEHGLYCYTTKGATRFTHCKFENCGQSPYLYSLRGSSACYRPHITMDVDNYGKSDLLTTFENCTFHCNGNYNVLTMYEGCPATKFIRCSWTGEKIAGYGAVLNGIRLSYCDFFECDNPCSPYAGDNMGDTIRTLRNCINVTNPFNCTSLVDNCECIIQYDDVYTRFSSSFSDEVRKALIVKNSSITYKGGNVVFRNKGRDIFFENCHIIKESDVDATIGFNEPNGDTNISLINCIIDAPAGQLLYTAADVYINKFTISGGVILNCSKALTSASVNKLTISGLFSNLSDESGRYVRTVKNSWRINALAQDINNRYYHESYVYLSEGGTYVLPNSSMRVPSSSLDLRKFVRLEPLGGVKATYTFSIANNGSASDSVLTISNLAQTIWFKVIQDFTNIDL